MDLFARLPEGCISEILSFTSPSDAIRSSSVSKGFKSASDSDTIWERFLPSDYQEIISRSVSPVVCNNYSKKDLYFALCDSPLLLDGGRMSFSVDKRSGKKCYMICARELIIAWANESWCWDWKSHPDSRFSEVISLRSVCWLDIRGRIETQMLSLGTNYAAYLLFRFAESFGGLEYANAVIRYMSSESDAKAESRASTIYLQSRNFRHGQIAGNVRHRRADGWMEVEMGSFYNDKGDDGVVEARLMEIKSCHWKHGLIVEGIEFRPKYT